MQVQSHEAQRGNQRKYKGNKVQKCRRKSYKEQEKELAELK